MIANFPDCTMPTAAQLRARALRRIRAISAKAKQEALLAKQAKHDEDVNRASRIESLINDTLYGNCTWGSLFQEPAPIELFDAEGHNTLGLDETTYLRTTREDEEFRAAIQLESQELFGTHRPIDHVVIATSVS